MPIKFNADLIDDLARQKVILFLGAGVSASSVTRDGSRIRGWHAFLLHLASRADSRVKKQVMDLLERRDYLLACEILQSSFKDNWDSNITDEFGKMAEPSSLHEAIIALNQRIIMTTNFDKLIETCWEIKIGTSSHLPKVLHSVDSDVFNMLKDHTNKYLVKLHGTVDDTKSLIFSRSEYIRLAFGNPSYGSLLENLFLNYTFLFVGFSMDDPAVCAILESYALRYPKARPHYMFTPSGVPSNIVEINKRLRKLIVLQYRNKNNDHSELPHEIQRLASLSTTRRRDIYAASSAQDLNTK